MIRNRAKRIVTSSEAEFVWQHPYVNVFKHFQVSEWKKASKEGEVVSLMDRQLKCTVYKVSGSIPAGNYIQLPKTGSQSLGLTGRYLYLLFKPIPSKYFVVHIDVATHDGLIVRISFSNLFKEFKSTSTWLQFPFVCHAAKGSISDKTAAGSRDHSGPAPMNTRWTALCLDLQYILSLYLNRRYSYIKSTRLCANVLLKNIFTSDQEFEPGITFDEVKKTGMSLQGIVPMPREMQFPVGKTQKWHDVYDMIKFPSDTSNKPFDSLQYTKQGSEPQLKKSGPLDYTGPKRVHSKVVNVKTSKVAERQSNIDSITSLSKPYKRKTVVRDLPRVGVTDEGEVSVSQSADGEVHVYAHPGDPVAVHMDEKSFKSNKGSSFSKICTVSMEKEENYTSLKPDPILKLRRIVGFGGTSTRDALWTRDGSAVVYPCHAVIVVMQASNGHQRFFIGHTDKVSCIAMNGNSNLLASGQTGQQSVVRVWKFKTGECLAMFKTHSHSLHCLSMSHSGSVLCGVGKDSHGKNMVVIWSTEAVHKGGQVNVIAKAHTDVDIVRMRIAFFDDTRMVSCGRENIRLWRVKDGQLRSAPVNLGEYHQMELTDCCFEAGYEATKDPLDRVVYACSKSGHIFEVDYRKVAISHVRRLLPSEGRKASMGKGKSTVASGSGIAVNSLTVNEAFCVTGSDDGYLRLWPLDFKHVYLEAEHEGPVTAVDISNDGMKILAGTSTGNLGILDVATRGYTTIMRSHTNRVLCMSVDPVRKHLATVSEDHTIRVWDLDTMQQLYDFSAPKECPGSIVYHPQQQMFACGFESGSVRVFNVTTTSMLAEHRQHRGKVTGLVYSPKGDYLYSSGSLGALALYDASENKYRLLRVLANTVARGDKFGPNALAVSPDGKFVAFVGPSDFTVSVVESRSLDEVMRIDISCVSSAAGDVSRTNIDTAIRVAYSPLSAKQLLVTTNNNKLIKFDARNGKLLTEVEHVHRSGCTALHASADGRHLCTAGDRVIKIWDYHMRLDINFQVFIGHAEAISQVYFAPDESTFISTGEAIFIWDFLGHYKERQRLEGRTKARSYYTGEDEEFAPYSNPAPHSVVGSEPDYPREHAPKPFMFQPGNRVANISNIDRMSNNDQLLGEEIMSQTSEIDQISQRLSDIHAEDPLYQSELLEEPQTGAPNIHSPLVQHRSRLITPTNSSQNTPTKAKHHIATTLDQHSLGKAEETKGLKTEHACPTVCKHYVPRVKSSSLAQRRFTAPPNQAGLKLKSVIGYNGNGRGNMVWNADTGLFAYSSGCVVVIEDLSAGSQQHLTGHHEEVSTLALQNDCQLLASASGSHNLSACQIIVWDLHNMTCKKVLKHHKYGVVCLAYSRDDRFLISVGDYRECQIVVWSTFNYEPIATTSTAFPIHDVKWDPYMCNEFAAVGSNGTVLFWLLDETGSSVALNVHEAEVPRELKHYQHGKSLEFTCLEYAGDSTLYIATSSGHISAWDTRQNLCFLHWEADTHEIDILISKNGRLISGSCSKNLKIWSTTTVGDMRGDSSPAAKRMGLTMEDEMNLDGLIISAAFDETMDMGIVGTSAGTLWYINWTERSSIRLVSGHMSKIMDVSICGNEYLATCCEDGSLRVWAVKDREQTLQFQVVGQPCNCIAFAPPPPMKLKHSAGASRDQQTSNSTESTRLPNIVAGYGDGTVRMFDLNKVEMVLKMHPHAAAVTAISFSSDGRMILTGASDGLVAVSSPTTGMTVRVISDHKGAPISCIDVTFLQEQELSFSAPQLWLAASSDRRVSVWSADWSKDFCELVDWLTFPAPAFAPDGSVISKGESDYYDLLPPTIAMFSYEEQDIVVYTGYGMQKNIQFYSLTERKVLRSINLTHWATSLDVCPSTPLIAIGNSERLLKLTDYYEGSFQDFVGHDDSVHLAKFSADGKFLFSAANTELLMWETML